MLQTEDYDTLPVYSTCWCHRDVCIQLAAHIPYHHEDPTDSTGEQANPGSAKPPL